MYPDRELSTPFTIRRPPVHTSPVIFNSPHSGRVYPRSFIEASCLDALTLRKSEDCYVEELFAAAPDHGAPLMYAHFPRAYLDVNREPYELDPALISDKLPRYANTQSVRVVGGLGTIARVVAESQEIYREGLPLEEALRRINHLYKPYHDALAGLMEETRNRFGSAVLIDCHSMPSSPALDNGGPRPDFILGDRFSTSCNPELTRFAARTLKRLGYVVTLNKPYAGGFITEHYGRPSQGFHSLQVEVNRALYLNETNFTRNRRFPRLRRDLTAFIAALTDYVPKLLTIPREAAE
ncbi:MAG: N-formylglutamate amidohydrolase [Alphaproteobacteria bacterium]|nr:MAG: N-formylglutamate amidohydrolase [Alphaproteobacteria bacterium]